MYHRDLLMQTDVARARFALLLSVQLPEQRYIHRVTIWIPRTVDISVLPIVPILI